MIHFRPDRLEQERVKRKWTQEEVAEKIGVARSTYGNYESGKREPDFKAIRSLADLFDVSLDYLTGKSDYRNAEELAGKWKEVAKQAQQGKAVGEQSASSEPRRGRAYYGGGGDWTEEERQAADAFIEMLRKRKSQEEQ